MSDSCSAYLKARSRLPPATAGNHATGTATTSCRKQSNMHGNTCSCAVVHTYVFTIDGVCGGALLILAASLCDFVWLQMNFCAFCICVCMCTVYKCLSVRLCAPLPLALVMQASFVYRVQPDAQFLLLLHIALFYFLFLLHWERSKIYRQSNYMLMCVEIVSCAV